MLNTAYFLLANALILLRIDIRISLLRNKL